MNLQLHQAKKRGGCQMRCTREVPNPRERGILLRGRNLAWGQTIITSAGILSTVMGKKENTSPVVLKGNFMSRS